jgi:hypothetical protein
MADGANALQPATLGLAPGNGYGLAYLAVSLEASSGVRLGDDGLPVEILLWRDGRNQTTKGTFNLTDRARKLVLDDWTARFGGLTSPSGDPPGAFDYDHDEFNDALPGYEKIAAGCFDLTLDGKDLWLTKVKFTKRAAEQILAKEKRSTSGAFYFDPKTGEFTGLLNVALTNLPATYKQPLLNNAKSQSGLSMVLTPPDGPQDERRVVVQVPAIVLAGELSPKDEQALRGCIDFLSQGKLESAGWALLGEKPATSEPTPTPTVVDPIPAAPVVAPSQSPETASMGTYSDPNFSATYHSYMLRYMASCDMESMLTAIYMNAELPAMSKAMDLGMYCKALAENITHCAAAMAECMTDAGEDDSMDEASLASLMSKTPEALKPEVEKALAACKTAKCGGLLQKAHKAALAAVGAKSFDKTSIAALAALPTEIATLKDEAGLTKRVMAKLGVSKPADVIPTLIDRDHMLEEAKTNAMAAQSLAGTDVKVARATKIKEMLAAKLISPADAVLAEGRDPAAPEAEPTANPYTLAELNEIERRAKLRLTSTTQSASVVAAGVVVAPVPPAAPSPAQGPVNPGQSSGAGNDQEFALFKAMNPEIKDEAKLREIFKTSVETVSQQSGLIPAVTQ